MAHQSTVIISTEGRGLIDITKKIEAIVAAARVRVGTCTLFVRHTSASIVIQENADPAVLRDLQRFIDWVAPERPPFGAWEHDDEGPDDMPAHVRSVLTRTSEVVPIVDFAMALGRWQAIYLWEHRQAPHRRELCVIVLGSE